MIGSRPYMIPAYVAEDERAVRVGVLFEKTEIKPLREEPTVVTFDDMTRYLDLLDPLIRSYWRDTSHNLVYANPLGFESDAADNLLEANSLDGCDDEAFASVTMWNGETKCPMLTGDLLSGERKAFEDSTASAKAAFMVNPLFKAKFLRNEARRFLAIARTIRATAKTRKVSFTPPPPKEVKLSDNADTLLKRYLNLFDKVWANKTSWGPAGWNTSDDFREVQGLDVDFQKARLAYTDITGLEPSMDLPSHVAGGESKGIGAIPWTPILVIAGLIAAAVFLGKITPFIPKPAVAVPV